MRPSLSLIDVELYRAAGGQAAASRPKLRVGRRPFLAPEAVIFGVDFTGLRRGIAAKPQMPDFA
jgi:hypothetical protein